MPSSATRYQTLLLIGVGLPAVLALANQAMTFEVRAFDFSTVAIAVLFGFIVVQIAVASWAVGRYIAPWPLRWIIWIWTMGLIDLQLATLSAGAGWRIGHTLEGLSTAVVAGQFSAIFVWGILGRSTLIWRVPSLLALLLLLFGLFCRLVEIGQLPNSTWIQLEWPDLLAVQALVLSILCGIIRLSGFTLGPTVNEIPDSPEHGDERGTLQFSMRDLLIAISSLAVVLAIARAGGFLRLQFVKNIYDRGFMFLLVAATATAVVMLVALWAATGRGNAWFRITFLMAFPLTVGWGLGSYSAKASRDFGLYSYGLEPLLQLRNWWIGWMLLTGSLLTASLLIYRAMGYRLTRGTTRR